MILLSPKSIEVLDPITRMLVDASEFIKITPSEQFYNVAARLTWT